MRYISAILAASALFASTASAGEPGKFDYYLFNLSWQPEFCHVERNAGSDECRAHGKGFVVHGLWPQYKDGYPEHCSSDRGPANPASWMDVMPSKWLVQHEWSTHGTCSGLTPDAYHDEIRKALTHVLIPTGLVSPKQPIEATPAQIKHAFAEANPGLKPDDMAVGCGNNNLTAIEICMDKKTLKFTQCGTLHDCHAAMVRITPVQ